MSNDPRRWPFGLYLALMTPLGILITAAVSTVCDSWPVWIVTCILVGVIAGETHIGPDSDDEIEDPQDRVPPRFR